MNDDQIRISVAKCLGIEPVVMWRIWYDKSRQHGSVKIPSRDVAQKRWEFAVEDHKLHPDYYEVISDPETYDEWDHVPDYPNDLNACAEFEKKLMEEDKQFGYSSRPQDYPTVMYRKHLREIVGNKLKEITVVSSGKNQDGSPLLLTTFVTSNPFDEIKMICATARQRCEAFLRVKGQNPE